MDNYPTEQNLPDNQPKPMGGLARASTLTPEQRSEAAQHAAQKRWSKRLDDDLAGNRPAEIVDTSKADIVLTRLDRIIDLLESINNRLK